MNHKGPRQPQEQSDNKTCKLSEWNTRRAGDSQARLQRQAQTSWALSEHLWRHLLIHFATLQQLIRLQRTSQRLHDTLRRPQAWTSTLMQAQIKRKRGNRYRLSQLHQPGVNYRETRRWLRSESPLPQHSLPDTREHNLRFTKAQPVLRPRLSQGRQGRDHRWIARRILWSVWSKDLLLQNKQRKRTPSTEKGQSPSKMSINSYGSHSNPISSSNTTTMMTWTWLPIGRTNLPTLEPCLSSRLYPSLQSMIMPLTRTIMSKAISLRQLCLALRLDGTVGSSTKR